MYVQPYTAVHVNPYADSRHLAAQRTRQRSRCESDHIRGEPTSPNLATLLDTVNVRSVLGIGAAPIRIRGDEIDGQCLAPPGGPCQQIVCIAATVADTAAGRL